MTTNKSVANTTSDAVPGGVVKPAWRGRPRPVESDFNLSRHFLQFIQDSPFYTYLARRLPRTFTRDIPTAGVSFDLETDQLMMYVNPDFVKDMPDWPLRGLLVHEMDHICLGHVSFRRREPHGIWNMATDLAINSLYVARAGQPRDARPGDDIDPLPKGALIPGQRHWISPENLAKLKEKPEAFARYTKVADLIESFPPKRASEWYFNALMEALGDEEEGDSNVLDALGAVDSHDGWDGIPADQQEYVETKVREVLAAAVRHADQFQNGWGNIPAEMREAIRRAVSNFIDWRAVLRQFIGSITRGQRHTSIKQINRRYPYVHPGLKRGYTAKLFVALDESGSVPDEMLELFFGELDVLTRNVSITICHFDCNAGNKDLYEWKKGTRPQLQRVKAGGTNFSAPTAIVNDPNNRGRWDGMLIMTDGQADAPIASRVKRGWVLGKGCQLAFPTTEMIIKLDDARRITKAWG